MGDAGAPGDLGPPRECAVGWRGQYGHQSNRITGPRPGERGQERGQGDRRGDRGQERLANTLEQGGVSG